MTNTNCLRNIKCPDCGNEELFRIAAMTIATVTDEGTEDHGDMEWDDDSYAECAACYRHGTLKDFEITTEPPSIVETNLSMTSTKYTRGPWVWDKFASGYRLVSEGEMSYGTTRKAIDLSYEGPNRQILAAAPTMLEALLLAQRALNTAPRFRVGDTDSYKIAAQVDEAIKAANASRER
jgi:hypothetical protein